MRPVAVFDIDGTIFRSSLVIELSKKLVAAKVFSKQVLSAVQRSETKWLDREGHYEDYIREVVKAYRRGIRGKRRADIVKASRLVIAEQKLRTYRFTRNLLRDLRGKYHTIGISGSPLEVVSEYNKFLKFDTLFGTENGVDERGRYTGVVLQEPPAYKKELIARYAQTHGYSFRGSIGIGDTESDIGFLELVDTPVCFNPNSLLATAAKKNNWSVVIERKDLIVEFKPSKVKFPRP